MHTRLQHLRRLVDCYVVAPVGGTVAPIFALTLIPMVGLAGAAIDYSRANGIAAKLQGALDAAVIAGARDGSTTWANTALNSFNANAQGVGASIASPSFAIDANRAYTGGVSATVPTMFMGMLGVSSMQVISRRPQP